MNIRRATSLTALLSFLVTVLTSVILYIVPQGRVAYWADWSLWGLSKEQWGAIHINVGLLMLLAILLHIYYNWTPILTYLKNRAKQFTVLTTEFSVALFITVVSIIGTYAEIPPFSTIIAIGDSIKEDAARTYGEPPYGHAELSSLRGFAQKTQLDLDQAMQNLRAAGYAFDGPEQTLQDIASRNKVAPQQIYTAMLPKNQADQQPLPLEPAPGTGNLTLQELCSRHGLDIQKLTATLQYEGITAEADMTIKAIGQKNSMSPVDVYARIHAATTSAE